jgi:hypothetical protein
MTMITAAPAAKQPTISLISWAGAPEQCPQWVGYPTRENFPAGLVWSGDGELPAIGARVHIYMNDFGPAEVRAYFHAEGFLGVLCAPDTMPAWLRESSPNVTTGHFFGRELEPRKVKATVAAAAPPAPQDDEPEDDDNQDSTEYPEHPEDEQRD